MSDPLLALRDAVNAKSSISYSANGESVPSLRNATHIVLGTESFPKAAPTRFRKPGTSSSDSNDFYTLEAVYLAWHLQSAGGAEYMKQARENGLVVGFVSVTERKGVVDWLEGHTSDHPSITPLPGQAAGQ
jgi:parafibromin